MKETIQIFHACSRTCFRYSTSKMHLLANLTSFLLMSLKTLLKMHFTACLSCSAVSADKMCRFVMCKDCCQGSRSTVCEFHKPPGHRKSYTTAYFASGKPTKIDLRSVLPFFPLGTFACVYRVIGDCV